LRAAFDPEWGGFGGAPKFPQPMTLEFLLRCRARGWDGADEMLSVTLDRMARGGMYDHVGGGFHRYSVDAQWHVPHFEKMLYDNAQLARLYARAKWMDARFEQQASETISYLTRDMRNEAADSSPRRTRTARVLRASTSSGREELLDTASRIKGTRRSARVSDDEAAKGEAAKRHGWTDFAACLLSSLRGAWSERGGNWEGTNVLWQPERIDAIARRQG
jgi:hypothetical protein